MIKLLYKTEPLIERILEEVAITRGSDHILYAEYYRRLKSFVDFDTFWANPHRFGGATFTAVERARRKIQARRPELKDSHTAELREEAEMDYINYAIGG